MIKIICIDIKSIRNISPGNWEIGNTYLVEDDDSKRYPYNIYTLSKDYINPVTKEEYDNSFITLNDWRDEQINTILND